MRRALLMSILVVLILGVAGSAVYAQDGGDKFVFGENFVLRSGEVLGGNLAVLGGTATLERGSTVQWRCSRRWWQADHRGHGGGQRSSPGWDGNACGHSDN